MKSLEGFEITQELVTWANSFARACGYWKATHIKFHTGDEMQIEERIDGGYRKKSNGQYVPKAYVSKGWSSVYYQHAKTVVSIPTSYLKDC